MVFQSLWSKTGEQMLVDLQSKPSSDREQHLVQMEIYKMGGFELGYILCKGAQTSVWTSLGAHRETLVSVHVTLMHLAELCL